MPPQSLAQGLGHVESDGAPWRYGNGFACAGMVPGAWAGGPHFQHSNVGQRNAPVGIETIFYGIQSGIENTPCRLNGKPASAGQPQGKIAFGHNLAVRFVLANYVTQAYLSTILRHMSSPRCRVRWVGGIGRGPQRDELCRLKLFLWATSCFLVMW